MAQREKKAQYRKDYQESNFCIETLDLIFELENSETKVTAISSLYKKKDLNEPLILNGDHSLKLLSLKVNDQNWSNFKIKDQDLIIYDLPQNFKLEILTEIDPLNNTALDGLYKSGGAFCTQCEAEGFRKITYSLDRPDILAKYKTKIIADKTKYPFLLSNGNKIATGLLDNDKHWVQWEDPFLKPSYLFALVAGDFDLLEDKFTTKSGRVVKLEIFVDKGNLDRANYAMICLKNAMRWDEDRFNLEYDLDVFMLVAVDFFNMGAMENKGLNIFNSKFVLANPKTATDNDYLSIESVIGHEYFHNWTGNRITCRDWFQLSLKEGLTVFRDQEFSSDLGSRSVNRIKNVRIIRGAQFKEDASPMSHPIRPEKVISMNNFYTLTVYEKGAEVIRMLHTLIGEQAFQKGMQGYIEKFDGMAITCDDFIDIMQTSTSIDLTQFRKWYSQSGTPIVDIDYDFNPQNQILTIKLHQETLPTLDQLKKQELSIPIKISIYDNEKKQRLNIKNDHFIRDNIICFSKKDEEINIKLPKGINRPLISFFDDFSAPVKINCNYLDNELIDLLLISENDFIKWDAAQSLYKRNIQKNIRLIEQGGELISDDHLIETLKVLIEQNNLDLAFLAEILSLPNINEITSWYECINLEAIYAAREFLLLEISRNLYSIFLDKYKSLLKENYSLSHMSMAKRAFKNICLKYLAYSEESEDLVVKQFNNSSNMTDTIAALNAANEAKLPCREQLMQEFAKTWSHDPLVMDKWFCLQGTNPSVDCLKNIKNLMEHSSFNLENPNRVRSLIGSFVNNNQVNFHNIDGSGYRFLTSILVILNKQNPQIASRLLDSSLQYKLYDNNRCNMMKSELLQLSKIDNLASDLYEKISKALV